MNNISMIGRLTAQPELKATNSGRSVCTFDIAVKRPFTQDTTDFFTCVIWERKAEVFTQYVNKGQQVGITGYGYNRKWQNKNGNNRVSFEINVNDFYFCENKRTTDISADGNNLKNLADKLDDMGLNSSASKPQSVDDFVDLDDEGDIPF